MEAITLIGQVAANFIKSSIDQEDTGEGVARFLLNRLTDRQVAEICRTVHQDPHLGALVKIQVPRDFVDGFGLPAELLTDERTVHLRHTPCDRSALLLANTSDDQTQSLADITAIGAQELKGQVDPWVEIATQDLQLPTTQVTYWRKALRGLQQVKELSLQDFAQYIVETRNQMHQEARPLIDALGWALPALRLPRDSGFFRAIPETQWGQVQRWAKLFQQGFKQRGCLLLKQTPTGKPIEQQELEAAFEKVREDIPMAAHPAINAFIAGSFGWSQQASSLAQFEWESENINSLFSGLKTPKTDLASQTQSFFEDEYPDTLTEPEQEYLQTLRKRKTKQALDEDKEFYEAHRLELEQNRQLKSKWDKFVYGQPIESTDFLVGLLQAFERLFVQAETLNTTKSLKISTQKSKAKSKWLELNTEVGLYFCTRYRGLEKLTGSNIQWETHWLFKYDTLLEQERKKQKGKYKDNTSIARTSTEIKFYVELLDNSQTAIGKTQLIWRANPNAIGMDLNGDLSRMLKNSPFQLCQVSREVVSKKGRLQGISLADVGTLAAAYRQDRGSLVSKYDNHQDLKKLLPDGLKKARAEHRLSPDGMAAIQASWEKFIGHYQYAIENLAQSDGDGIASPALLHQQEAYGQFLETLLTHAKGDRNRLELCQLLLRLGAIKVERGKPAAIIAPWHPLRMAAIATKARQLAGLLRYLLSTPEVNFGDSRLFFADLQNELAHSYYPEVCVGYQGQQPELLAASDTVNDYTLMECPTRDQDNRSTHEDPVGAVGKILDVIHRYVELQPHERANLSVVLYDTDSIKLPQAIVQKLGDELQEDQEEVRCQVILRHRNQQKLAQLYGQILESSDADPDAFVASEFAQDFMARLRISVMGNDIPATALGDGKYADIVFLQDAISHQAKVVWQPSPFDSLAVSFLKHYPARWSRKRAMGKDELKSTVYLTCPKQPSAGQAYLDLVYSLVKAEDCSPGQHWLPSRQVSFQDEAIRTVFTETHRLGEWVVNYDDLLERRQLLNQGVQVIRYQQHRSDERNFLISSNSSLSLLKVLVRRRLQALTLHLESDQETHLVDRILNEANAISGDIVLRAAKNGRYASELMGVALSKALITSELGTQNPIGWYFLDDYASWLGQREGQIADIMAIAPLFINQEPVLKIIISEAKYIDAAGLADARKTSQKQLRDTVFRIASALFISPSRLDRDLWLARLSDLLLEGIEFSSDAKLSIDEWREGIRNGEIRIDLCGYSHVFATGASNNLDADRVPIPKVERCWQEVYDREHIRQLVLAYQANQSLTAIRAKIGDDKPWEITQPLKPAASVMWVLDIEAPDSTQVVKEDLPTDEFVDLESSPLLQLELLRGNALQSEASMGSQTNQIPEQKQAISVEDEWATPALSAWLNQQQVHTNQSDAAEQWLKDTVNQLRSALMGYSLQAKILGQRLTPNAAIIRLKGSDNLKLEDIEKRRSQLLTTHALNIISIYGQPGEIIVSVARPQRQVISLQEVWAKRKINCSASGINLSFVIGVKEIDGELLYLNLGSSFENLEQHAPHTLIAGATGSGKSVLLQNLLLDICATNPRRLAQIYLIDPKMGVDYANISDLPHLKEGIITEQDRAIEVMEYLVEEMDSRYRKFVKVKAQNLQTYNSKVSEDGQLPVIWLVHDEFAEWMLVDEYKSAVSSAVQRLGVKARAAGIYLIFAAQRPDANVLPVQLRDNLGNRLILRVESVGTSEISLGQKGAENLLGKGHMAARLTNQPDLIFAQVPFLTDEELYFISESIKREGL
jgi:DNA segregation ATPase FtsK/SpoIIIE, S-DNA-T family